MLWYKIISKWPDERWYERKKRVDFGNELVIAPVIALILNHH